LLHLLLEHCDFLNIDISQGSVATRLGCGRIFRYDFRANFLLSLTVKEFENRLTFGEVTDGSMVSCFLTHSVFVLLGTDRTIVELQAVKFSRNLIYNN